MKQKKQDQTQISVRKKHHKMKMYSGIPKGFRKEIGNLDRYEAKVRKEIASGKRNVRIVEVIKEGE